MPDVNAMPRLEATWTLVRTTNPDYPRWSGVLAEDSQPMRLGPGESLSMSTTNFPVGTVVTVYVPQTAYCDDSIPEG